MDVPRELTFNLTRRFGGDVLPPVSFADALHRVRAYCTEPGSGWSTYDLCSIDARLDGQFDTVSPWSLLWADALAGQVRVRDIAGFDLNHRIEFTNRLIAIPASTDLHELDAPGRAAVTHLCQFGFSGVWGPKATKVAALFRPQAVPVLDGYVALAFGFARGGFSQGREPRWQKIARVIDALTEVLATHQETFGYLRQQAQELVPELSLIPTLRLLDIIIWTSQDDRMQRPGKPADYWVSSDLKERRPITRAAVTPVSLATGRPVERDLPPGFGHWPPPLPQIDDPGELPPIRWTDVRLGELGDSEPSKDDRWYDMVPWVQVMEALRPHVVIGGEVDASLRNSVLDGLPPLVQEGIRSLFVEPLGIQEGGEPIGGGHRMLAMKRQGLTHAYGMD